MNYLEVIDKIWPRCDIPLEVLKSFEGDIVASKLDPEQIREVLIAHRKNGKFAKKNPDMSEVLETMSKMRRDAAAARAAETAKEGPDFIEQQRRIQAKSNPAALHQPRWKILAAWLDREYTNRTIDLEAKYTAAEWVMSCLMSEEAGYNNAVYAAAAIYDVEPAELDRRIQEKQLKAKNSKLVNAKRIKALEAKEKELREKRMKVTAGIGA